MKKTILTVLTVFAASAIYAQGFAAGDGGVTRAWMKDYYNLKQAAKADTLSRTVAKKVEKKYEQATKKKNQKHFAHLPATGAMRDYAVMGRMEEEHAVANSAQRDRTSTHKNKTMSAVNKKAKSTNGSWFTRISGVAKQPNENIDEWNARMYANALK